MSDFTESSSPHTNQVELELVQQVLAVSGEGYCWSPSEENGDSDPDQVEEVRLELAETPQTLDSDLFFEALESAWNEADAALALEAELTETLGDRVPQPLLQTLLTKAQQVGHVGQTLGDQLVHCVQGLIPQLDGDDLQVMARPYALAMRDRSTSPSLDVLRSSVRAAQWAELSPIERARLSLGISHYALSQLARPASSQPRP